MLDDLRGYEVLCSKMRKAVLSAKHGSRPLLEAVAEAHKKLDWSSERARKESFEALVNEFLTDIDRLASRTKATFSAAVGVVMVMLATRGETK